MSPVTTLQIDRNVADEVRDLADARGVKLKRLTTHLIKLGMQAYRAGANDPLGIPADPNNDRRPGSSLTPNSKENL
jgi:hypothetical protein